MSPRKDDGLSEGDKHFSRLLFGGMISLAVLLVTLLGVTFYLYPLVPIAIGSFFVVPYLIGMAADRLVGLPP